MQIAFRLFNKDFFITDRSLKKARYGFHLYIFPNRQVNYLKSRGFF